MSRRLSVRSSPSCKRANDLDLVADFGVAGQIGRLDPALADPAGGLELGPKVFRFLPLVHQPGGLEGDLPTKFLVGH